MSDVLVRDRDGDLRTIHDPDTTCICDGTGWSGVNHRGQPIPCYTCKPHLVGRIGPRRRRVHTPVG